MLQQRERRGCRCCGRSARRHRKPHRSCGLCHPYKYAGNSPDRRLARDLRRMQVRIADEIVAYFEERDQ